VPTFHQTYQVQIVANQPRGFLDVPTRDAKRMQLASVVATATHAVTNAGLNGIDTVVQSNGFMVKPSGSGKPDIVIMPGATLRIMSSRTTPSSDPVRVSVVIEVVELS
jgi:hypothetical protein